MLERCGFDASGGGIRRTREGGVSVAATSTGFTVIYGKKEGRTRRVTTSAGSPHAGHPRPNIAASLRARPLQRAVFAP